MCQPGAVYVCDWKPLDNALHASSFPHLVFFIIYKYIYMYVKTRRRACSNYGKMNAIRFVGWDVLLTWFGIYTFFSLSLLLSFFCRTRIEFSFHHLSFFSSLLTGDSISLSSSFQLSKWTNQSPLTSLFFLARSPRALSFLVSVASSSFSSSFSFASFFFIILVDSPMHQSFPFEFFSSLSPLLFFSRCHPPRNTKKNSSERKRGGWTPRANPWIEKQKSNTHTYIRRRKKRRRKRRRKNREKENSFFSIYMSGSVRCLSLENKWGRLFSFAHKVGKEKKRVTIDESRSFLLFLLSRWEPILKLSKYVF